MQSAPKILVVDDEPDIIEFVTYNLSKAGYQVVTASDGEAGIEKAKAENPDLILLDVMMPKMDGIVTCQELREIPQFENTLIAFLTARSEDYSQIAGFESGADDYITKPIRPKLLVSRIKALLKRRSTSDDQTEDVTKLGCITLFADRRIVTKGEARIELTKKEFDLLQLLSSKVGKVYSRERIYQTLWGDESVVGERTLDVHIRKLREKIGNTCIKTVKGVGYKYNEDCS